MIDYKIGVQILLTNSLGPALTKMTGQILGMNNAVNLLNSNLNRFRLAAVGSLGILGGGAILAGTAKLIKHGNDLVKIQRDMAQAGASATEVQEAYAKAWQMTGRYQNMSAVEVMKMINDARMTFGDQGAATHHIEPFVEMASFLKAYEGGKHSSHSEALMREINSAMKSGELAGKVNPEDMAEHVKQLTAMKIAYGDQVKIGQYLTAQRAAGVALRNSSDSFRYGMFPALVQENGPGAGVMLMTAFNKIVAGVGNRTKSLEHMADIGLLKPEMLDYDKVGRIKGLKDPAGIMNSREAAVNFGDWVMKTFKPLIDAKTRDPVREAQLISGMFPDRNAAKAITEIIQQYRKLAKDAEMMAKARAAMDAKGYTSGSWDYQTEAFKTQWENLLDVLGAPLVARATAYLGRLNEQLAGFSQWASKPENAGTVDKLMTGFAALGSFFLVGGGVALLAALGPAGWFVGGLAALATILANKDLREGLVKKVDGWLEPVKDFFLNLQQKIMPGLNAMGDAIYSALKGIWDRIIALFSGGQPKPDEQFKKDLDDANKRYTPMRFDPALNQPKPQPISLSLNVDGRTLAQAVSDQIADLLGFRTMAPSADGVGGYHGANMQV